MKKILVPIDFSNDSINAFEHAIVHAENINAKIRLINICKNRKISLPSNFLGLDENQTLDVEEYFEALLKYYESKTSCSIEYLVREGKVYKEITDQAGIDNTYLIVMGTHGISGFEELFMGSNAFRVVTNSPCPVITIRNGYLRKGISKIIVPIDITKETRLKVPFVAELASFYNAEVHVAAISETERKRIIEKTEQYSMQVCDYLAKRDLNFVQTTLFGSNITDMTIEYAISVKSELIAIMTEQPKNAKNLFMGPYAQQMVNHSPIPVLSLNANNF
ncbi:MAG: universal stress protein [Bacteroidales bacterium]|nr:universal stress protein [Bacteroidales bacterium]